MLKCVAVTVYRDSNAKPRNQMISGLCRYYLYEFVFRTSFRMAFLRVRLASGTTHECRRSKVCSKIVRSGTGSPCCGFRM